MSLGLPFWKVEGAGNDFVCVEWSSLAMLPQLDLTSGGDFEPALIAPGLSDLARWVCDRTTGLGADGLVLWNLPASEKLSAQSAAVHAQWCIVNSDGSFAETCGNAARCMGLILKRLGWWSGSTTLSLESTVGKTPQITKVLGITCTSNDIHAGIADVVFSQPKEICSIHPATCATSSQWLQALVQQLPELKESGLILEQVIGVLLSNPHLVFLCTPPSRGVDFKAVGRVLQNQCAADLQGKFPLSNIGFLTKNPLSEIDWDLTVFERGAGLTQACGSGTVAASYALSHLKLIPQHTQELRFHLPGGLLSIIAEGGAPMGSESTTPRILRGPTRVVARGELV